MQKLPSSFVSLLALGSLVGCGPHRGGEPGGGGSQAGEAVGGGGASGGSVGGSELGGSAAGGFSGGGAAMEYPPRYGYEPVEGCEPVMHPGHSVLTLFDDPNVPFMPQHISGDGQVAAGLVGEVTGSWRDQTGFVPYDLDFRGNVQQLDCSGEYAVFYDTFKRGVIYVPGNGISVMLGGAPSYLLPMKLAKSGGGVLVNYIDSELTWLQPYDFYDYDARAIEEYRNTVLYNVDRDGYYLGVDALRVFYNRPSAGAGLEIARLSETGPLPRLVVSGNDAVLAMSLANGSVLWGPINPADPRRQRQQLGYQSEPLAISGAGRVVLLSNTNEQIWIEETYFTAGGGFRSLTLLASAFGADVADQPLYAVDMSQDAQAFVGYTMREGRRVGFHLTLPREAYPEY